MAPTKLVGLVWMPVKVALGRLGRGGVVHKTLLLFLFFGFLWTTMRVV